MTRNTSTPWGPAQTSRELCPGITFYTTASHGGYGLTPERAEELAAKIPGFSTFTGDSRWYEEDEDWAVVDLAFAEHCTDKALFYAVRTARFGARIGAGRSSRWAAVWNWLTTTDEGRAVRRRADRYGDSVAVLWERGRMSSVTPDGAPRDHWTVFFHRNGEHRQAVMPYPTKTHYSDEELAEHFTGN